MHGLFYPILQTINAIGFALFWAASIEHTSRICIKEISTTMFSILSSIHFSLAVLIGNMIGGFLYDLIGAVKLFQYSALFYMIWSTFLFAFYQLTTKKNKRNCA